MVSRRDFVRGSAALGGALLVARGTASAQPPHQHDHGQQPTPQPPRPRPTEPGQPVRPAEPRAARYTPVVTPNGVTAEPRVVGSVKVFHLVAEAIGEHEFAPGLRAHAWGYNGRTPGPTLEVVEGDRVRIYVTNRLPEATSVHWHGVILPSGMDGVEGLSQRHIRPGETFRYEFTFELPGTFMYHPHVDEMTQMAMGMMGMIVVHPRRATRRVDRDFALILNEWLIPVGAGRVDPREMNDQNIFTFNSKAFPGTDPLVVRTGQRVRIRIGNLSAMHNHPIHLHGHSFEITATDGGAIPESAQWPETTVLVPVGATRDVEFVAKPGDWAMHCHFTHHVMNQMGHEGPNMIGMRAEGLDPHVRRLLPGYMTMGQDGMAGHGEHGMPVPENSIPMRGAPGPYDYIDMGGMFTIVKVRDGITSYEDPGWYEVPPGTLAREATADELRADGVELPD